ncbi:MAG: ATP-grasp domain-containing protein [Halioglobus sp.]
MPDSQLAILVTAIGGGGFGEQILKAVRIADNDRYIVVGTDAQESCPQFDWVDVAAILPRVDQESYLEQVFSLCKRYDVKGVFPGCEAELKFFSAHRQAFSDRGITLFICSQNVIKNCLDKTRTNALLQKLGFEPPRYLKVTNREELSSIDWFPVIVKPAVGAGGSANCFIAQSTNELLSLYDYINHGEDAGNFIVQEYVGTPAQEYTVGVLHDLDGNYINAIALRRVLSGQLNIRTSVPNRIDKPELGENLVISSGISQGYVGRFPQVTEACAVIAKAIGVTGAVNIQCRLVDGKVKIFEINPRFSGTTSIRAMVGYNEPDVLIRRHLFSEIIPESFSYDESLVLRGLVEYRINQ